MADDDEKVREEEASLVVWDQVKSSGVGSEVGWRQSPLSGANHCAAWLLGRWAGRQAGKGS